MTNKDIILHELTSDEISAGKPFAHFGWEGGKEFSFMCISDGYWESAKIILITMINDSGNFALVDSLIYPLFFNYRHSVETILKALYFSYGNQTEEARQNFLKVGHNLENLWGILRPFLIKGVKHVGSEVDLTTIEHYIKSINAFDPDSMIMRYPIEKNLKVNKEQESHFDFINFGERMNDLCNSLRQLNYDLSNQMTDTASSEELDIYLGIYEKYRQEIINFISILEIESKKESERAFTIETLFNSLNNKQISPILQYLNDCDSDLLILFDNLFYGGRSVNEHVVRLSNSAVTRQKEFVKFCNELMNQDGLCFGKHPEPGQINIYEKTASALLEGISTAISILNLE